MFCCGIPKIIQYRFILSEIGQAIWDIEFSPDDTQIAVASNNAITIYDAETFEIIQIIEGSEGTTFLTITWHPDGESLVYGGLDSVGNFEPMIILAPQLSAGSSQTNVQTFEAFCSPDFDPTVTQMPDEFTGTYYATVSDTFVNLEPYVIHAYSQSNVTSLYPPIPTNEIRFADSPTVSPDGRLMAFRTFSDNSDLVVWDTITNELAYLSLPDELRDAFSQNPNLIERYHQKMIWSGNRILTIRVFDEDAPSLRLLQFAGN